LQSETMATGTIYFETHALTFLHSMHVLRMRSASNDLRGRCLCHNKGIEAIPQQPTSPSNSAEMHASRASNGALARCTALISLSTMSFTSLSSEPNGQLALYRPHTFTSFMHYYSSSLRGKTIIKRHYCCCCRFLGLPPTRSDAQGDD